MGKLSQQHSRGKMRRGVPNRAPLRKIVSFEERPYPHPAWQVLECGHKVREREDFIGPLMAVVGSRRRCKRCEHEAASTHPALPPSEKERG